MKAWGKSMVLVIFCGIFLLAEGALAGEFGEVTCTTPDCGYKTSLDIGGRRKLPAVTGYCAKEKKFVRLKLKSHDDYRKPHYCPNDKEPLKPIYRGADISKIPCPKCGNLTLKYQLMLRKD
ncbi:MAG: hypothetical protein PHU44_18245 [Syntrophales bacterium]|nr:hypothetical protein [Syntrophales bacterium]MDD5642649.1 hypothetical protein [Syntrophales bacterium]